MRGHFRGRRPAGETGGVAAGQGLLERVVENLEIMDRLAQEIEGPAFAQGADGVVDGGLAGEHHHLDGGIDLLEERQELQPVEVGQVQIEHDEVVGLLLREQERLKALGGRVDPGAEQQ
ncbi:hypothetical protein D3C72_1576750 [compost metagenome]